MILLIFLIIGSVSAADSGEVLSLDDDSDTLNSDNLENDALSSAEVDVDDGNFNSLDTAIQNVDAGGTVHLNTNVTLNDGTSGEETTYEGGMTISKDVTINGYDQIINATDSNGNKVRVFNINSGAHVTLKDMTIAGASFTSADGNLGSAITLSGSSYLTLINVHFIDNYGHITGRNKVAAGAIMVTGSSTLNVTGGSFVGNTIRHDQQPYTLGGGGAINVNTGTLYVNGVTFENNTADFAAMSNQAGGGAIASLNSHISIVNSEFIGNRVTFSGTNAKGGAVYVTPNSGRCDIINNSFINNHAYTAGALFAKSNNINAQGCIFEANTATDSIIATFSDGVNVTHNAFVGGQKISKSNVNEEANWWGTNEPTDVGITLNNWIVMTLEHDDSHVIAKLTSLNDGTAVANPETLPVREATITGLGETRKVKVINGVGTLTLDESIMTYVGNTVTATVDGQSLSFVIVDKVRSFTELESNIQSTEIGQTYDVKGDFQLNSDVDGEEITYAQGIVIDKDIIIDGHGYTINATDASGNKVRIFNIKNGAAVTLRNITLAGGDASSLNGGAILVDGATLTVTDVTFTENSAANGGAVYSDNGNVNIINSTFVKNTAASASAVQISSGLIEGCIFEKDADSQSTVVTLSAAAASAHYNIFFENQTVSGLGNFDCNWWGNNTPDVGVSLNNWLVLSVSNDDTLIKVGLFALNTGDDTPNPEKLPIIPAEIRWDDNVHNLTLENGAATVDFDKPVTFDSAYNVTAKLFNQEVTYTLEPKLSDSNNFVQLNETINGNDDSTIDLSKNYKLNEVNINEQTTFKNGIVIDRDVVIDGHGITINATDDNGNKVRIFNIENANVTLKNMILTGASVTNLVGGAIYVNGGSLTLINVTLCDNQLTITPNTIYGGAALGSANAQIIVENCSFINNKITKSSNNVVGGGAAIYLNGGSLDVVNSLFEGNVYSTAGYNNPLGGGGAIYTTTAITNIANSRFIRNSVVKTSGNNPSLIGGALLIKTGVITGNVFEENTAAVAPNAVSATDSTAIINYNAFIGSTPQTVGGSANYQYNWWGTNTPQSVGVTLTNWIVMDFYNNGKDIYATLNTLNDGSEIPNPELMPVREATFTWEGSSYPVNTTNAVAFIEFNEELTPGISYESTAKIDSQTLSLTIKPNITSISVSEVVNGTIGVNGNIKFVVTGDDGYDPSGSISLWLNDTLFSVPFSNNEWSLDVGADLDGGVYDIYFKYDGDGYYCPSLKEKSAYQFGIDKINPSVSIDYTNFTYLELDTPITVDFTANAIEPTGYVTVRIDGKEYSVKINKGIAVIPIGLDLNVSKDYNFTVSYEGDSQFNPFESQEYLLTVLKYNTTVSADLSKSTVPLGENATISVIITPEGVVIEGGGGALYTLDKDSPAEMLSELGYLTKSSPAPTASISGSGVSFISGGNGDDRYVVLPVKGSSIEFKFVSSNKNKFAIATYNPTVEFNKLTYTPLTYLRYAYSAWKYKAPSSTNEIAVSGYKTAPANGDIFKVTIADGKVYYYINDVLVISMAYSYSEAYFGFRIYASGTNVVDDIAVYGDGASGSAYVPEVIPTGNVTVTVGNITKEVPIVNGQIDISLGDTLAEDIYDVEISYSGDGYYNPSVNNTLKLEVKKIFYNATIDINSPSECELGKNITVSVEVTGRDDVAPTGEVTVQIGDIVKKFEATSGIFTIDVGSDFTAGEYEISVYYEGDDNYLNKSSNATFTINQVTPPLDITTTGANVFIGNDAIVYIKVNSTNGVIPTGNVTVKVGEFSEDVILDRNGQTSYNVGKWLVKGLNDVEVTYNGDVNYKTISQTLTSVFDVTDTVYVNATEGDDENGDGSSENPFKSIKKAFSFMKGDGNIVLNGLFKGSDNIGLTLTGSNMINVNIIGNDAIIDAEITSVTVFKFNKVNAKIINLTINNSASYQNHGALFDIVNADSLDLINSTFTNMYVRNGKWGAIYIEDDNMVLNISNSTFIHCESNFDDGLIVSEGSSSHLKVFIDNSLFEDFKASSYSLIASTSRFSENSGAEVVITGSKFINFRGASSGYSQFADVKSLNMSYCIIESDFEKSGWGWLYVRKANVDYNFWSSNNPDFSHLGSSIVPNNWIVMTFDNESSQFIASLNTLNDGSELENISSLPPMDVTFSDNLNPTTVTLDENGTAKADLVNPLKVGEEVTAKIAGLTLTLHLKHDVKNATAEVVNTTRWTNGTITITVEGKDDVMPTGNVTIFIKDVPYTVNLTEGVATLQAGEDLPVGTHTFKFQYNGDDNYFAGDETEFEFEVERTDLTISIDAQPVVFGQNQVISFTVLPNGADSNITVIANNRRYTVNLSNPTLDLGILPVGSYNVSVVFEGDENANPTSANASFNVTKKAISIDAAYDKSIKVGEVQDIEVTFKDLVENYPTGGIVLFELDGIIYNGIISDNRAGVSLDNLKYGNHTVTVSYEGDNYILEPVSITFEVSKNDIEISAYAINATAGNDVSIVISGIPADATGPIFVTVDGTNYGAKLVDGNYVATIPALKVGTDTANVLFDGDAKYNPADTSADFTVTPLEVNVEIDVGTAITKDSEIVISAANATGELIVIVDDEVNSIPIVDGNASYSLENTAYGDHNIVVIYNGVVCYADQFTIPKLDANIAASAEPVVEGKGDSIVVVTANATAKGSVVVDGKYYGDLSDGSVAIPISGLTNGTYVFTVKYSGDDVFNESETSVTVVVLEYVKSDANIAASAEPVVEGSGDSIVVVTADATAKGSVVVDGKYYGDLSDGSAVIPISGLTNGTYVFTVKYSGDDRFNESETSVTVVVLEYVKSDANIAASAEPVYVGSDAIVVVTANATAKGSVVIDGKYYGELSDGIVEIPISGLTNGTYVFTVNYSGDDRFKQDETTVTILVNKFETTPDIRVESIELGEDALIEVTLTDGATGNVTFYVDDEDPVTVDLLKGYACIDVSDLTNGTHKVKVVYSGDVAFAGSEAIEEFSVTYDITIDGDSLYGDDAIIRIDLPDGAEGNVTVTIGNETFKATVEDGVAYVNASTLGYGTHEITVTYSGDDNYPAKTVTGEITVDTNINIPDEVPYNGGEITISLPSDATGNVTATIDGKDNVTVPVVNGAAVIPLDNLSMGDHKISATYSGDDKYKSSTVTAKVTVNPSIDVPDELTTGSNDISISLPSDAGGNLTVTVDGKETTVPVVNGTASISISELSAGNHNISVDYSGDGKYDSFHKSSDVNVAKATPSAKVNAPASITAGKATTLSIELPKDATGVVLVDVAGNKYYATAENGVANVNIAGLSAGNKQLTYNYLGDAKYNAFNGVVTLKIVSEPAKKPVVTKIVLTSKNVKVKKSAKKLVLQATLKINGKAAKGKKVIFKFKGKKYTAKTNKKGVAKVTIKKNVIKKLKKGKKYTVKITYSTKTITKKVTVKK